MNEIKVNNFKRELRDLLKKYNAEIYAQSEGDRFSDEICIDIDDEEIMRHIDCISHCDIIVCDWKEEHTEFTEYGTKTDGGIFYIEESKLNQDHINQIRNYLTAQEKKLKTTY